MNEPITNMPAGYPTVYEDRRRTGLKAAALIGGGVLYLLVMLGIFLLQIAAIHTPRAGEKSRDDAFPGILGGASVIGIFAIAGGVRMLRGVRRAVCESSALRVEGFISSKTIPWSQIARTMREKKSAYMSSTVEHLVLHDSNGKELASIPASVEPFAQMVADIEARAAAAVGRPTYDRDAERELKRAKDRKSRRRTMMLSAPMILLFATIFGFGLNEELHTRRYASEGVTVDATVVRTFMRSVTPYVEYRFADRIGTSFSREVMIDKETFDSLFGAKTVPVRYLPSDPSWNRLANFDSTETTFGGKFLFLSGGLTIGMGGLFLMVFLGFDVKSVDGKSFVSRYGEPWRRDGAHQTDAKNQEQFQLVEELPLPMPAPPPLHNPVGFPVMPPPGKPVGLIALGVISVVFGLIGLLLGAIRINVARRDSLDLGNGQVLLLHADTLQIAWLIADTALAALLLACGIGLIRLRRWGRTIGIPVAALQLASSIASIISSIVILSRARVENNPDAKMEMTMGMSAIIGSLIGAVFPLVLLLIISKRSTREALGKPRDGYVSP